MGDVASLAVRLHLNAANFKSQLMSAYGKVLRVSHASFNRNASADAKKTEDATIKRVSASVSGAGAGRLAGFAGAGLSLVPLSAPRGSTASRWSDLQGYLRCHQCADETVRSGGAEMGRTGGIQRIATGR